MPNVPTSPKVKKLTTDINSLSPVGQAIVQSAVQDLAEDNTGLETIRQYAVDQIELRDQVKAANEVLGTIEQGWDAFQKVEDLAAQLKTAKQVLRKKRLSDPHYLEQTEKVAAAKREQKEAKEILSDYLVAHFKQTGERQVLMNDATGDAREVILSGKLGRETKYQTSLDLKPKDEA